MNRVRIREHVLADLDAYAEWRSDAEIARFLAWLPQNGDEARTSLVDAIDQQKALPRTRFFFAVVLITTGEMVGDVGLTITGAGTGDCGWFIRKSYWGCGYATEAAKLLVEYAFGVLKLDRLVASCAVGNHASERVMLKSGFDYVQRSETCVKYEFQRSKWENAQQALPGYSPPGAA